MSKDGKTPSDQNIPLGTKAAYIGTGVVVGLAVYPLLRSTLERTRPSWIELFEGFASKAEEFAELASEFLEKAREELVQVEREWRAGAPSDASPTTASQHGGFPFDEEASSSEEARTANGAFAFADDEGLGGSEPKQAKVDGEPEESGFQFDADDFFAGELSESAGGFAFADDEANDGRSAVSEASFKRRSRTGKAARTAKKNQGKDPVELPTKRAKASPAPSKVKVRAGATKSVAAVSGKARKKSRASSGRRSPETPLN